MSIYVKGRHNKKESLIEMVLLEKKIRFEEFCIFLNLIFEYVNESK